MWDNLKYQWVIPRHCDIILNEFSANAQVNDKTISPNRESAKYLNLWSKWEVKLSLSLDPRSPILAAGNIQLNDEICGPIAKLPGDGPAHWVSRWLDSFLLWNKTVNMGKSNAIVNLRTCQKCASKNLLNGDVSFWKLIEKKLVTV